jgi:hypothetical protein
VNPNAAGAHRRGFAWALFASLLLHALTLSVAPMRPGDPADPPAAGLPPLVAVTLLPPPAASPAPGPLQPPAPASRSAPPVPPRASLPVPPGSAAEPTATASTPAAGPSMPPADATAAGTAAVAESVSAPAPAGSRPIDGSRDQADTTAAAADDASRPLPTVAAAAAPPPASVRFPSSGRLDYAVSIGSPPTPVGRATYAWEASETAYRLSLSAETTGLVGLLRRVRVVQMSEGRITPDGLRPDAFSMDRGPKARNEFARFDWAGKQITFGYPDAQQTAALGDGTQDTLSLILQFAFVPIGDGRREVLLTTGRRLYVQTYERVGEEVVETPAGNWRAWHLRRVRAQAGDEGYDMWLATDRPFLPVRIRWTDRNGRVTSATLDTVRLARD